MNVTSPCRWSLMLVLGAVATTIFAPPVATADAPQQVTPARVKAAIAAIEQIAKKTIEDDGAPGIAIAIVHKDQVVFKQGFGVREAGKSEPIDADTVFQIASVSKPLSSTVMALLVGEGAIAWDDRVTDHDPNFVMYTPYVTRELRLRDFLCHRSGLPDHAGDLLEDLGYDRQHVLKQLRYQPPDSSFRAGYAYTNTGYSEACYAAALAVGKPWEELAAEKLFAPLGMKHTSYRFADYEQAANRALLHVRVDGKWTAKNTRQPDAQAPAGGASTTLNDISQWLRLQLGAGKFEGRQLVAAETLAETHQPQFVFNLDPASGRLSSYGLGWLVSVERGGRVFYKHSGEFALGVRSEVAILPSEELAIAVLSNAAPSGIPEGITESFFDLVLDGKLERDWMAFASQKIDEQEAAERGKLADYSHPPTKPNPPLALATYTGKYANQFFGEIEIAENGGRLVMRAGPKPLEFPLTHWDRDEFIYQPTGEMASGLSGVSFTIGPEGKASRVLVEFWNVHGQGSFERVAKPLPQADARHERPAMRTRVQQVSLKQSAKPKSLKLLYVGNSYTFYHDLPKLVAELAAARGVTMEHELVSKGGATLEQHLEAGDAAKSIEEGQFDYVVLQEQSLRPLHEAQKMAASVRQFDELIKRSGAKTVLYMTWAREDAPEAQKEITKAYRSLGKELGAIVVPVGRAWESYRKEHAAPALYADDGSHPTLAGSYLAACVFVSRLLNENPVGIDSKLEGLSAQDAEQLQSVAWQVGQRSKPAKAVTQ